MTLGVIWGFDGFHLTTPLQFTQNSFPCFIYSPTCPFLQSVIFLFRRNYYKFCLWLQTTGLLHLMHNIFVVINSVKSFRQTVNARGLGMVEMHEGLDHLRSVVVVPNPAPGVSAKTNAREDTLVGPTRVVTTIHFVAHGFDSAKNKKRTVLATFSVPEAAIVLFSAKDILALAKRTVASTNKNDAKQSSCHSLQEFFISMVSSR